MRAGGSRASGLDRARLARVGLAEMVGTLFLVAVVVGSGIAADRLSPGDTGLQLLENALATGAGLVAVILAVGAVSGAHLNPVVSLAERVFGGITTVELGIYVGAQVGGGIAGCVLANLMFDLDAVRWSTKERTGSGLWLAEVVATVGLLLVIFGLARSRRSHLAPFAVGAYIASAYFFTSSTSFANPAVAIGRMFSDTFAGIDPSSTPAFIGFELVGAVVGIALIAVLYPTIREHVDTVVVPHAPAPKPRD